jgi:hypothetical protein
VTRVLKCCRQPLIPFRGEFCSQLSNGSADDEEAEEEEGRGEDLHKDQALLALLLPTLLLLLSLLKCLEVFTLCSCHDSPLCDSISFLLFTHVVLCGISRL